MIYVTFINAMCAGMCLLLWSATGSYFPVGVAFFSTAVAGFTFGVWLMSK